MCRTPALFRRLQHFEAFRIIHGDRFFAKDMFARCNRRQRDGRMEKVRRGDDDGLTSGRAKQFLEIREKRDNSGLRAGLLQHGRVGVAQRRQFGLRAERQSRQMILQNNPAATNDADANVVHATNKMRGNGKKPSAKRIKYGLASMDDPYCPWTFESGMV